MREMRLKVIGVDAPTAQIRALTLAAEDGADLPGYSAGAHIRVNLPAGGDRPYSLVNFDPARDATASPRFYRLGVRLEAESRGGSSFMHSLTEGDTIAAAGPKNDFKLADSQARAILVAGGIGVTPIASMASQLRAGGLPFTFHYTARSRPLMAFVDELAAVCGDALRLYFDDEPGRAIDLAKLIAGSDPANHLYVCGPRGMIEAAREAAHGAGFARDQVHFELFQEPQESASNEAFEVEIRSTGQVFAVPPDKTIIQVLEAGGVDLMYDCRRGDCGICQTVVLEGIPDHRDVILTEDERAANNVMQICVSRSKSPRLVLDL